MVRPLGANSLGVELVEFNGSRGRRVEGARIGGGTSKIDR